MVQSCMHQVYRWLSIITQDGDSALILASGLCETEAIVELIKAGANVNLQNDVRWHCVCFVTTQNIVLIYIEWGVCSDESCQVW